PDTTPEAALKVAERIRRAIAAQDLPNALATPPLLTLCIGIATVIEGDPGAQALFDQADAQLYKAKQAGRDRVCATVIGS
ncbi:diguanylate cyclase, partial [Paracandidimonas soli]|uniref:diguanylate cyclase n=1 Tax=Paracandidimonas soli TaxID=1917182 RepID=UPI00334174C7